MNSELDNDKITYSILETLYIKNFGSNMNINSVDIYNIFPFNWFSITNYKKRIEILTEALEKNILIVRTSSYIDMITDVIVDDNQLENKV